MRRTRIYISGPISKGDLHRNVSQATLAFQRLALLGYAPLCPHWSVYAGGPHVSGSGSVYAIATASGFEGMAYDAWIDLDLAWVETADAVLRLPGESVGADREVEHAHACGIPVHLSMESLTAWEPTKRGWQEPPKKAS